MHKSLPVDYEWLGSISNGTKVCNLGMRYYIDTLSGWHVKLNANRVVVGTLRGFDQFMNLVVDNIVEVVGKEPNDIGMVVIRGNSVVMIEVLEPVGKT
ncbi:probable small nuclear ribonucleoprotein G [Phoenix dactylifera]|uniref:Probable small nuclear ribonucleoprotein G n=1 Tax=Phoenix dactylifera TaxID=42345 RepID=A0A8B9B3H5_PHODC|nr:probable small nuclear ribonucleoprotein G [Phoenix dactylifera]